MSWQVKVSECVNVFDDFPSSAVAIETQSTNSLGACLSLRASMQIFHVGGVGGGAKCLVLVETDTCQEEVDKLNLKFAIFFEVHTHTYE